jgi:hypothetical protein
MSGGGSGCENGSYDESSFGQHCLIGQHSWEKKRKENDADGHFWQGK